jgi:hypothetical protein
MRTAKQDEAIVSLNQTLLEELQLQELDTCSLAEVQGGGRLPFTGSQTLQVVNTRTFDRVHIPGTDDPVTGCGTNKCSINIGRTAGGDNSVFRDIQLGGLAGGGLGPLAQ